MERKISGVALEGTTIKKEAYTDEMREITLSEEPDLKDLDEMFEIPIQRQRKLQEEPEAEEEEAADQIETETVRELRPEPEAVQEEAYPEEWEEEEPEPEAVCGDPDPVDDFKPPISLDHFNTMDLRVCKILKCEEIRKARSNYKLTLFDGKDKRIIVSSLKDYYKPEQLEGRKIIVIANLEPARLTGVQSNGMLLATTNNASGCKVIFVDDLVPEGTAIH